MFNTVKYNRSHLNPFIILSSSLRHFIDFVLLTLLILMQAFNLFFYLFFIVLYIKIKRILKSLRWYLIIN